MSDGTRSLISRWDALAAKHGHLGTHAAAQRALLRILETTIRIREWAEDRLDEAEDRAGRR